MGEKTGGISALIIGIVIAVLFVGMTFGYYHSIKVNEKYTESNRNTQIASLQEALHQQYPDSTIITDTVKFQANAASAKVLFGKEYKDCVFPNLKTVTCDPA